MLTLSTAQTIAPSVIPPIAIADSIADSTSIDETILDDLSALSTAIDDLLWKQEAREDIRKQFSRVQKLCKGMAIEFGITTEIIDRYQQATAI